MSTEFLPNPTPEVRVAYCCMAQYSAKQRVRRVDVRQEVRGGGVMSDTRRTRVATGLKLIQDRRFGENGANNGWVDATQAFSD